jgi:hypothetical protein
MTGFPVKDKFLSKAHVHVSLSVDYFKKFSVTQSSQRRYRLPGNQKFVQVFPLYITGVLISP